MNLKWSQLIAGLITGVIIGVTLGILSGNFSTSEVTTLTITSTTTLTTITTTSTTSTTITYTQTTSIVPTTVTTTSTLKTTTTVTNTVFLSQEFMLVSPSFEEGENIPTKYTCDGSNVSPPLSWNYSPEDTKSFALIMDDPDAPIGVFTHWVLFNLPENTDKLPEGLPSQATLENGGKHGINGLGQLGYFGPCPPSGPSHTYRFRLYALDLVLNLESGASKEDVLNVMEGHILAEAELTAEYSR